MMVEQTIEGRFIAPQVLGNNLKIHPVTILIVLLSAGKAFGLVGVILGVPGYAIIKVIAAAAAGRRPPAPDHYEIGRASCRERV